MPTPPWKRSAARKLWRAAKAKHNKALTAKQIKFKKDLGPRLDKLDLLLAKKPSAANERALLKLAVEIKGIVKEYRLSLKGLSGGPQRELEAVLKKVFSEAHTIEKPPKKKAVVKPSGVTEGTSGTSGPGVKVGTGQVLKTTTRRAKESQPTETTSSRTQSLRTTKPAKTTRKRAVSQTPDTDEMVESLPEQKVPQQPRGKRLRGERLVPNAGGGVRVAPDTDEQSEQDTEETVSPRTPRSRRGTFGSTRQTRRLTESGTQEQEEEEVPLARPRARAGTFGQTAQEEDGELTGLSEQDEPGTTTSKAPPRDQNTIETTETEDEEPELVAEDGRPPVNVNTEDGQTEREDEPTPG